MQKDRIQPRLQEGTTNHSTITMPNPILHLLDVTWLIGTPILLLIPYTSYLKMKILTREDLRELAYALAPKQTVNEIYHYLRPIIDHLID